MVNKKKSSLYIFGCEALAVVVMLLVYGILVATGVVHLKQNTLVFVADSADKVYDGEPISDRGWSFMSGKLQSGHTVSGFTVGSRTMPGVSDNVLTIILCILPIYLC